MSFESTAVYYRMINEMVRLELGGIASAEVLLHSVNFAEIVDLWKAGRWDLAEKRSPIAPSACRGPAQTAS